MGENTLENSHFEPQVVEVDGSDNLPDFNLGEFLGEPAVHFFLGGGLCSSPKNW